MMLFIKTLLVVVATVLLLAPVRAIVLDVDDSRSYILSLHLEQY
jgi:hypothetical protein